MLRVLISGGAEPADNERSSFMLRPRETLVVFRVHRTGQLIHG